MPSAKTTQARQHNEPGRQCCHPFQKNQPQQAHKTTTMAMHAPQDHHTEALHPTRYNHWKYHWFDPEHLPPPNHTKDSWKPSCNDKGCGHCNCCYDCNDSIALLLVDKAEFMARRQLKEEYPEAPHPNPPLLRPHQFHYMTDINNENYPKGKTPQLAHHKRPPNHSDCA
jgi:hypothetical protein